MDYSLTRIEDRSGNSIDLTYSIGYLARVENSDGSWVDISRPVFDPQYPPVVFPNTRIVKLTDSAGREISFDYNSDGMLIEATVYPSPK